MPRHLAILPTLLLLTLFALSALGPANPEPTAATNGDTGSILDPDGRP